MWHQTYRFFGKLALYSIPFWLFVLLYVMIDPLKVCRHYDNYYEHDRGHFSINHGYAGTANFDNHYAEFKWNSFILGNSRSRYWKAADWQQHLAADSRIYHFDAHSETLYGMLKKVEYLDSHCEELNNALLIFDQSTLRRVQSSEDYLFTIAPALIGNEGWARFQLKHFQAFCDKQFLKSYIYYQFGDSVNTPKGIIHLESFDYDYRNNEILQNENEQKIQEGTYYTDAWIARAFTGYNYPDSVSPPIIGAKQREMLQRIKAVFERRNTSYRIVVSPAYDQIQLAPVDVAQLAEIFGASNVYDFSGTNEITTDIHNYYEFSHYRPVVAKILMDSIYH